MSSANYHSFPPAIAATIGIPAALVLKYLAHLQRRSKQEKLGKKWCFPTISRITSQFPYMSRSTVKNAIDDLKAAGMIEVANHNRRKADRTQWYHVPMPHLDDVEIKPHRFNKLIAAKCGIPAAVIYQNLRHWTRNAHRQERKASNGHPLSPTTLAASFPYLSIPTIKRALKTLVKKGFIEKVKPNRPIYKIPDARYKSEVVDG